MKRKTRKWDESAEDDPGAGLVNLFDVWIAFAVALLLATVSYFSASVAKSPQTQNSSGSPAAMEMIQRARMKLDRYRVSRESAGGDGQRLGTAYRLQSGEVIYVPDGEGAPNEKSASGHR